MRRGGRDLSEFADQAYRLDSKYSRERGVMHIRDVVLHPRIVGVVIQVANFCCLRGLPLATRSGFRTWSHTHMTCPPPGRSLFVVIPIGAIGVLLTQAFLAALCSPDHRTTRVGEYARTRIVR